MKSFAKAVLAAVAAGGLLAGCATYDYGYGYTYSQPYSYGYDYGYGGPYTYGYSPYYYGYSPYYYDYGPSYYVGPSVGFGFTYRDRDHRDYHNRRSYSRNDDRHRNTDYHRGNDRRGDRASRDNATRPPVTQRNVAPANSLARPVAPPPTQALNDPYGGTNKPYSARNSQQ